MNKVRSAVLALLAQLAAATGAVPTVRGGQHPDAHVEGFVLRSAFIHQRGGVLRRHGLAFDDAPHLRHGAPQAFESWTGNSVNRNVVLGLAKLNVLAYPGPEKSKGGTQAQTTASYGYAADAMDPLLAADPLLGANNKLEHQAAMQAIWDAVAAEVAAAGQTTRRYDPDPGDGATSGGAIDATGVAALEFVRGQDVVLVFRGSYSPGDYSNIRNWVLDWMFEKMTAVMKSNWVDDAGLTWTQAMEDRGDESAHWYCLLFAANELFGVSTQTWSEFAEELSDASGTVSGDEAAKWGYWPITKAIVDSVRAGVPAGGSLTLSGHSQGGGRAQLASMYLRKQGHRVPAVTFSSAGGGVCTARRLTLSAANLVHDMDPYIFHDQIVDYVHALDPWGHGLGIDPGVTRFYSRRGDTGGLAAKYCESSYGQQAMKLVHDNSVQFRQCRAITHLMESVLTDLQQPGVVNADGTTIGGERNNSGGVPAGSARCPDGGDLDTCSLLVKLWIAGLCFGAFLLVVAVSSVLTYFCCPRRCDCVACCRRRAEKLEFEATVGLHASGSDHGSSGGADTFEMSRRQSGPEPVSEDAEGGAERLR